MFVELPAFERHRDDYFDDDGFSQLQVALMANPVAGDLIEGTGGLRKVAVRRFSSIEGQAWRSARDLLLLDWWPGILAITLYDKDEMADLTPKQRAALKERVKDELKMRRKS